MVGATPPYHKGRQGIEFVPLLTIWGSIEVGYSEVLSVRRSSDAKGADSAQRVYLIVPTKPKRKPAVSRDE